MEDSVDLYSLSSNLNLINICRPLLDSGWYLDTDGKLKSQSRIAVNMPWVFARQDDTRKCNLWHGIFFNVFGWLPSPCLECWKLVVRPKTIRDLIEVREIQTDLDWSGKCGIEVRESVCGLYGGYWYNDSKEQAKALHVEIQKEINNRLEQPVDLILKRGCTEFEHKFGDSKLWEDHVTEDQVCMERKLDRFIETHEKIEQPQVVKDSIYKRWIEFAHASGDTTYLSLTGGKPLYKPYRTYNDEIGSDYG